MRESLDLYLQQTPTKRSSFEDSVNGLAALALQIGQLAAVTEPVILPRFLQSARISGANPMAANCVDISGR